MKADPMTSVTIILTTLNSERFLARSIESCQNQTYRNLELLVVDGGSRDRTLELVAEYQQRDPRIRVVHQADNTGKLPGAINLGMANAAGAFITWTQDDCWYEPNAIQTMVDYLDTNPEVAFVYTDFWEVDTEGNPTRYQLVMPPEDLIRVGDVVGTCFLFRREVYEKIGPQDVRHYSVHELPWRIKAAQSFRLEPLHTPLMYYTVHPDSLTGRFGHWSEQRKALNVIWQEGYIDTREYRLRQARIDMHEAYEEYILNGNYRTFWLCAFRSIGRNLSGIGNRGLWKLMLMSLLPGRKRYRARLLSQWQASVASQQAELIAKYAPQYQGRVDAQG
jgi:glycosyltransferase involved in cell wall biosynthesis